MKYTMKDIAMRMEQGMGLFEAYAVAYNEGNSLSVSCERLLNIILEKEEDELGELMHKYAVLNGKEYRTDVEKVLVFAFMDLYFG